MVDVDRRPTAQEIEELIDLVQRDPASPAFIDLGEAYLALGRPRDALGVGGVGLEAAPDSLEGRVMVARAHAALHQWKEAQGELLRVVKIDRSNRRGFALLGEILLRRNDFERAVPVLQHAQNLDPTSPQILSLLKRARSGQPLDPPPPLPMPIPPRGETMSEEPILHSRARPSGQRIAAAPALVAPKAAASGPIARQRPRQSEPPRFSDSPLADEPATIPGAPPLLRPSQPVSVAAGPRAGGGARRRSPRPVVAPAPPPLAPRAIPAEDGDGDGDTSLPTTPDVRSHADLEVRGDPTLPSPPPVALFKLAMHVPEAPRVHRARDLAAETAGAIAPSETFINDLLTANTPVVTTEAPPPVVPDKRWGRSTRLVFGVLFGLFVLGTAGGGVLYWYTEKLNREAIAELHRQAKQAIANGEYTGLTTSIARLAEALDKDKTNSKTLAYAAETAGLDALLYGAPGDAADQALNKLGSDITPDDEGWRELVIGKAALELSRLGVVAPGRPASEVARVANSTLIETGKALDEFLASAPSDKWAKWLRARAQLAAGKRKAGIAGLDEAAKGEDGLVVAMIDRAALYGDDGALDDSIALYDKALKRSANHPLAVIGKALVRAEAGIEPEKVVEDLAAIAHKSIGARVSAYRSLASGLADLGIEDYVKAAEQLKSAVLSKPLTDEHLCASGPAEPRFWAGVAWGAFARGDLNGTANARNCVAWYGKERAEDDPAVLVVDAALAAASGHPEKVLTIAKPPLGGTRARLLRLQADLDLGKIKEALSEADEAIKRTTPADGDAKHANLTARILDAQARYENAAEKERDAIASELDGLAHQAQSKLGHHALGMAYLAVGDTKNAQPALEDAVKDVSDTNPNPIAYRTRTALADLLIGEANDEAVKQPDDAKDKLAQAGSDLDAALKQDSGYDPALATEAKLVLRLGDPDKAASLLEPILREGDVPPSVMLTFAEVLVVRTGSTQEDKDRAAKILRDIKDTVRSPAEVGRIAALIDDKLPAELGVPAPPPPEKTRRGEDAGSAD